MVVFLTAALAGGLTLDDPAGRISPTELERLERAVARVPFDVHAGVDDALPELDALTARATELREAEGGLVVLVDPTHRHTVVQIDGAVGVKKAYFDDIRASGDDAFREGSWGGGLVGIVERADARRRGVAPAGVSSGRRAATTSGETIDPGDLLFPGIALGVAAIALIGWMLGFRTSGRAGRSSSSSGFSFGSTTDWSSSSSDFGSSGDSGSSGGDSGGSSGSW